MFITFKSGSAVKLHKLNKRKLFLLQTVHFTETRNEVFETVSGEAH